MLCFTASIDVLHPETRVILIGAGELCTLEYIRQCCIEYGFDTLPGVLSFVA